MRNWGALGHKGAIAVVTLAACVDHPDTRGEKETTPHEFTVIGPPSRPGGDPEDEGPSARPPDPTEVLTEVVYVLMDDFEGGEWMCTGALVSARRVVTAAHCLDPAQFSYWEIVAPLVEDRPRVTGARPSLISLDYEDVANPDIGFLRLDEPLEVEHFAELTSVVSRVEQGEGLTALAIVRTTEAPEAPLRAVTGLALASTKQYGYEHGLGAPIFSHGGDSGAGIFLMEDGMPTHKLVAILRTPEPERNLDHFTEVDQAFIDWYQASSGE